MIAHCKTVLWLYVTSRLALSNDGRYSTKINNGNKNLKKSNNFLNTTQHRKQLKLKVQDHWALTGW